jgi:hypothetical protein
VEKKRGEMEPPTQIQDKLDALGVLRGDVTERFVRGSGPGGQKINKTSSTVHLRHEPTGVEVRVQRERSQAANRELAWAELCEKLLERLRGRAGASAGGGEGEAACAAQEPAAESDSSCGETTTRVGEGAAWESE